MKQIRGWKPGATVRTETVHDKTGDDFDGGYWISLTKQDIKKPGNHRLNLPLEVWNHYEIGDTIEVVYVTGDLQPYHRDSIYADDGNFAFDRGLQMVEIAMIVVAILAARVTLGMLWLGAEDLSRQRQPNQGQYPTAVAFLGCKACILCRHRAEKESLRRTVPALAVRFAPPSPAALSASSVPSSPQLLTTQPLASALPAPPLPPPAMLPPCRTHRPAESPPPEPARRNQYVCCRPSVVHPSPRKLLSSINSTPKTTRADRTGDRLGHCILLALAHISRCAV